MQHWRQRSHPVTKYMLSFYFVFWANVICWLIPLPTHISMTETGLFYNLWLLMTHLLPVYNIGCIAPSPDCKQSFHVIFVSSFFWSPITSQPQCYALVSTVFFFMSCIPMFSVSLSNTRQCGTSGHRWPIYFGSWMCYVTFLWLSIFVTFFCQYFVCDFIALGKFSESDTLQDLRPSTCADQGTKTVMTAGACLRLEVGFNEIKHRGGMALAKLKTSSRLKKFFSERIIIYIFL